MSAWVVSHAHIDAILTWAVENEVYVSAGYDRRVTEANAGEIGRTLLRENIRSVEHRYPSEEPDALPGSGDDANDYVPTRYRPFKTRPLTSVELIKAVDCLEYQSCEHDGWKASEARAICQDLKSAASSRLPGYDAAPWGFDRSTDYSKVRA